MTISGSGFGPAQQATTYLCRVPVDGYRCVDLDTPLMADPTGQFSGTVSLPAVFSSFGTPGVGEVDCRVEPCGLVIALSGTGYRPGELIDILQCGPDDPVAPICHAAGYGSTDRRGTLRGHLVVRTRIGRDRATIDCLVDGQLITVTGEGFRPGADLELVQCTAAATSEQGCDRGTLTYGAATAPEIGLPMERDPDAAARPRSLRARGR